MAGRILRDSAVVTSRQGGVVVAFFAFGIIEEDFNLGFVGMVSEAVDLVSFVEKISQSTRWWLNSLKTQISIKPFIEIHPFHDCPPF